MTVAQVSNGEQTFLDINGDPLSGGQVFFYAVGTTTPQTTWSDINQTIANPNPVILDQAGRAPIWGQGEYRQIVTDQFGNTQWDLTTSAGLGTANNTFTGTFIVNGNSTFNGSVSIADNLTVSGNTNLNALNVTGATDLEGTLTTGGFAAFNDGMNIQGIIPGGTDYTLDVNGNAGIGGRLDVTGAINCNSVSTFANQLTITASVGSGGLSVGGSIAGTNNGIVADHDIRSNQAMFATAFNVVSDRNLKVEIEDLQIKGLDILSRVSVKKYEFEGDGREHWGFVAQDLETVTGGKIGSGGSISVSGLTAILWKALQETMEEIEKLRVRVKVLEAHVR